MNCNLNYIQRAEGLSFVQKALQIIIQLAEFKRTALKLYTKT